MCNIRYWEQIAELKADRLGVALCEKGKDAFVELWGRKEAIENENKNVNYLNDSNVLNFIKDILRMKPCPNYS